MKVTLRPIVIFAVAVAAKFILTLCVGLFVTPDSIGYERIADAIVESGAPVLMEPVDLRVRPRAELDKRLWHDFAPLLAFRAIGYPLVIAATKVVFGDGWIAGVLLLQCSLSLAGCVLLYKLMRGLMFGPHMALMAAIFYGVSPVMDLDQSLLTDSLYASLITCFVLLVSIGIVQRNVLTIGKSVGMGLLLAAALLLREATQYLAVGMIPLVAIRAGQSTTSGIRRVSLGIAMFAPLFATIVAYNQWSEIRTGERFLTTLTQVTAFYPIFVAERYRRAHRPDSNSVFDTDNPIDVIGRQLMRADDRSNPKYGHLELASNIQMCRELNLRLSEQFGLNSLEIAKLGTRKFVSLWLTRPRVMLGPVPERFLDVLTVLRPLDIRFVTDTPPEDVSRLVPFYRATELTERPRTEDFASQAGDTAAAIIVRLMHVIGKGISACIVGAYLALSIWVLVRFGVRALTEARSRIGQIELLTVGFGVIVWAFLLLHAAIHVESRYIQPVAPLILVSFILFTRERTEGLRLTYCVMRR
jgi:hypothetical protein